MGSPHLHWFFFFFFIVCFVFSPADSRWRWWRPFQGTEGESELRSATAETDAHTAGTWSRREQDIWRQVRVHVNSCPWPSPWPHPAPPVLRGWYQQCQAFWKRLHLEIYVGVLVWGECPAWWFLHHSSPVVGCRSQNISGFAGEQPEACAGGSTPAGHGEGGCPSTAGNVCWGTGPLENTLSSDNPSAGFTRHRCQTESLPSAWCPEGLLNVSWYCSPACRWCRGLTRVPAGMRFVW